MFAIKTKVKAVIIVDRKLIISKIKAYYLRIPYSIKIAISIALIVKLLVFSIGYIAAYSAALTHGYGHSR